MDETKIKTLLNALLDAVEQHGVGMNIGEVEIAVNAFNICFHDILSRMIQSYVEKGVQNVVDNTVERTLKL